MKNKNFGFTLVELLVVIAIIGILSSVAIINLQSAKDKATQANVQAAFSQLIPAVIVCHDDGLDLQADDGVSAGTSSSIVPCGGATTVTPLAGHALCTGSSTDWPTLETGWIYEATCTSVYGTPTWTFDACEGSGSCTSGESNGSCDSTGCDTGFN